MLEHFQVEICDQILAADQLLFEAATRYRLLAATRPLNELEAQAKFLAGYNDPELRYPGPIEVEVEPLRRLQLPDTLLGSWLKGQRRQLLEIASVLAGRASLAEVSRRIYGSPTPELQEAARRILRELPVVAPNDWENLPWVRGQLRKALRVCGLNDWTVSVSPGNWTAARPLNREIVVTRYGPVPKGTAERLAVHEVGVHALRSHNGFGQPLKLFGYGLPGYEATEEGLAVYSELLSGTADARILRRYAARVLAVGALARGLSFRQSFEEMLGFGLNEKQSWSTVLRAHRGGGLYKDHIYLEGLFKVMAYHRQGGSLETLYMGKVGLQHLEALGADGLGRAARLPWFLQAEPEEDTAWRLIQSLAA